MTIPESAINATKAVLAKCAANDPWFPNPAEATILAWAEQFVVAKIPLDDLLAAVTQVYATNGSGFKPLPADIIRAARAMRADRGQRETEEQRRAREARIDARLTPLIAELAEAKSVPDEELRYQRPEINPLAVLCPHEPCRASVARPCRVGPDPLRRKPRYHPSRIDAASTVCRERRQLIRPAHDFSEPRHQPADQ